MRIRDWSSDVCSSDLVLSGEGVDGEPSHAELQRALDGIEERLLPRRLALCSLQSAPGGPAPVPVHDARDVRGYSVSSVARRVWFAFVRPFLSLFSLFLYIIILSSFFFFFFFFF